jgi:hypothetical protein
VDMVCHHPHRIAHGSTGLETNVRYEKNLAQMISI